MQTDFDAVVVGAGPAGATAATLLATAGWQVALVEKQRFPRRKVCGECIAASNLPLLDALGLGPAFEAVAGPELRRVALMQGERTLTAELPSAPSSKHPWGRALGRETLDSLLVGRARAAGAVIMQPWSVQTLDGAPGSYRCEVRAVESSVVATLRAPLAIAAQGSWEPLPSARAQRRDERRPSDLFAFKANFRGATLAEGLLPVLAFAGGYGGMVVADHGTTTIACCIREDRLAACRREAPALRAGEVVEALLRRECLGVAEALRGAERDGAWLASGPLQPGIRLRPDDRLLRIGNAAGEAHPIIGEGMSIAMQSAWLLCAHLLGPRPSGHGDAQLGRGPASSESVAADWDDIRDRYAADWRRHFAPRLRLAAAFAHLAMRPAAAAPLLALLHRWPGLLTQGARWSGKLRCAADAATIARLASGATKQPGSTRVPSLPSGAA